MATSIVGQQSHSVMTQHFQSQMLRSQSNNVEIMTPDGDLGDVEADFQRMVNEMAQDTTRRTVAQPSSSRVAFSSNQKGTKSIMKSSMSTQSGSMTKSSTSTQSGSLVRAVPARVISPVTRTRNISNSEVVNERTTRVRDQIKKIERQLSQEDIINVPESSMPRLKSSSVKNLSEQFERPSDTADFIGQSNFSCQDSASADNVNIVEGHNVRRVTSHYQQLPSEHVPPTIKTDYECTASPVQGVVRSASNPAAFSSFNQQTNQSYSECSQKSQNQEQTSRIAVEELEKSLDDINKYTNELSRSLSETNPTNVIEKPLQYSAQVRCEVKARVNGPEVQNSYTDNKCETRQSRYDAWSSSSSRKTDRMVSSSSAFSESPVVSEAGRSHFTASAPTPLARSVAKPLTVEGDNKQPPPHFSLLRSASATSAGALEDSMRIMNRSISEKDLPKFNVKKVNTGSRVWSPGSAPVDHSGPTKLDNSDLPSFRDVPPVWNPVARGGSASPGINKEYRKITFDGPTVPKRAHQQENREVPKPEESFAWQGKRTELRSESHLPRAPNPTVTLLQKKREGLIQDHKPDYILPDEHSYYKPGDKLYTIKKEYESEDEERRKFAVLGPRKIEGVGPITKEGMPISLKSGVKSEHHGEWYKRMFDSIHKVKDESNTRQATKVRYGGYMSEPEGYDSDTGVTRYAKYDRSKNEFEYENTESNVGRKTKRYVHQPGRIENYVPGFSSLSERELRENPEADVKLELSAPRPSRQTFQGVRRLGSGYKESGYDSDSTLVFKKREDTRRDIIDPSKNTEIYREIQRGGEIPLSGLRRPAPRPKAQNHNKYETSEVNIHYRTPIRVERKEVISDDELARRQEEHMKKVYEQERRKKYLSELDDIERRRHTDNFTPLQKSPIPLNRYDDEIYGGIRAFKTPEPRQLAKALFGFQAQNKRELNFSKGDIITIRRHIDKNWMEGELKTNVGIFPSNYVEVLPFDNYKTAIRRSTEGQARVRFNFQAQTSMEMSLNKGEIIVLTRRVDDNWFEGRIGLRKGIFPVAYVDVIQEPVGRDTSPVLDTLSRPALPPAHLLFNGTSSVNSPYSTLGHHGNQTDNKVPFSQLSVNTQQEPISYRALYNYKPQNDDELELLEGDAVMVMEKCDDGWFVGTSQRTNSFGTFPGNYVEKM